jgi:type 1 glutamine amidotransferase
VFFVCFVGTKGYGAASGMVLHTGASLLHHFGVVKTLKLSRNTAMLSVLAGGALGSFVYASTAGKSQVHNLHPVFQVGAHPKGSDFNYQRTIAQAKLEYQQKQQDSHHGTEGHDVNIMQTLTKIQAIRRKTLSESLREGRGLSDSHGGQWVHNTDNTINNSSDDQSFALEQQPSDSADVNMEKLAQNQIIRRKTLMNSIERGHGLSDSHGGHWVGHNQEQRK